MSGEATTGVRALVLRCATAAQMLTTLMQTLSGAARVAIAGTLGLAVFGLFVALMAKSAPTPLTQQISRERNDATAVIFAGFSLGIAVVIAATLRGG